MSAQVMHDVLGLLSGSLVGFSLGLVGGGGSILAVPLLIYLVGVPSAHVAIGTSALAVAANAAVSLSWHARRGNVKWRCAAVFAAAGVVGAFGGSSLSKAVDGRRLLVLFALLMLVIAALMVVRRFERGDPDVRLNPRNGWKLVLSGLAAGALAGFFGIGGGFLVVPGLILATHMPILNAIGSSLVAVTAFGATAAANYASSGLVDWRLAASFIGGGLVGAFAGGGLADMLGGRRGALNGLFAGLVALVAVYMLVRSVAT